MLPASLTFAAPWLLMGLAALPIIWYLLRFTPPAPNRIVFPAARLLEGLVSKERTPARSPWWLTALRILAAALIILALAGPLYNPDASALPGGRPLLIVVDNGWASATQWSARQRIMNEALRQAESEKQTIYLATSSNISPGWRPEALSADKARTMIAAMTPAPAPTDRAALAKALEAGLANTAGLNVLWLNDGIEDGGAVQLWNALQSVAKGGAITVATNALGERALALFAYIGENRQLTAKILSAGGEPRTGVVHALNARGERLGEAAFVLRPSEREAIATLALPVDLQNQVARLEIANERSAGTVYLLDSRSLRRRVGIISGDPGEGAQPLLAPTHYIEKALSPFAEISLPGSGNIDTAVTEILQRNPSVIALADIGRLVEPVETRLRKWVERGGLLIRFAGPRMEQGTDGLMPVRLREGGRTLGGALSWSTPQKLAPFEKSSPFFGLAIPADIEINRQILADPAAIASPDSIWARLQDGTPLVTSNTLGKGRLVLFHVTGHPDWSNLPLSGVFIDMLRRTLDETTVMTDDPESAPSTDVQNTTSRAAYTGDYLPPWRTLSGFGELGAPRPDTKPIAASPAAAANIKATPGYYGQPDKARAVNLMSAASSLSPALVPTGAKIVNYTQTATLALTPWLFVAALIAFAVDAVISLIMTSGRVSGRAARLAAGSAAIVLMLTVFANNGSVAAQPAPTQPEQPVSAETLSAALKTRLAYVVTGDDSIDQVTNAGLKGLTRVLAARTAVEPAAPVGVNLETDELTVFPLLYWAVPSQSTPLPDTLLSKIDSYMKTGGMIIFDTRDYQMPLSGVRSGEFGSTVLGDMLSKLDLPRLEPATQEHVITKSFYILRSFPGRWDGGELWVEAQTNVSDSQTRRALKSDGVSSILVTSNDLAAAWALDDSNMPLYPAVPGGEEQREMAFRAGVNIVMYALTGNYKADQVHVPALLERLGH
ncbi:MAG: DUF4159 domain-containing protein [Hyphomicrobiales bacterium]|nr:DUF4159 domain-containing protein [Hyphomicrobiales bacterium]